VNRGFDHLQVVLSEALETAEGTLAVIGNGVVNALFNVWADIIGTSLSQLGGEVVNLFQKENYES
jgi:hypothetical protein